MDLNENKAPERSQENNMDLYHLVSKMNQTKDFDDVIRNIMNAVVNWDGVESACLWFYDENEQVWQPLFAHNMDQDGAVATYGVVEDAVNAGGDFITTNDKLGRSILCAPVIF